MTRASQGQSLPRGERMTGARGSTSPDPDPSLPQFKNLDRKEKVPEISSREETIEGMKERKREEMTEEMIGETIEETIEEMTEETIEEAVEIQEEEETAEMIEEMTEGTGTRITEETSREVVSMRERKGLRAVKISERK